MSKKRYYIYNEKNQTYLQDEHGLRLIVDERILEKYSGSIMYFTFVPVKEEKDHKRSIETFSGGWNELD